MKFLSLQSPPANLAPSGSSPVDLLSAGARTLAIATLAIAASAPLMTANATVIYDAFATPVTLDTATANISLAGETFVFSAYSGKDYGFVISAPGADFGFANAQGDNGLAYTVAKGSTVSGSDVFTTDSSPNVPIFGDVPLNGYFGFRFDPKGSATPYYGWGNVSIDGLTATLNGIGYENSGAAITVGDIGTGGGPVSPVPEPATWLLMVTALGLIGVLRSRYTARS